MRVAYAQICECNEMTANFACGSQTQRIDNFDVTGWNEIYKKALTVDIFLQLSFAISPFALASRCIQCARLCIAIRSLVTFSPGVSCGGRLSAPRFSLPTLAPNISLAWREVAPPMALALAHLN